MLIVLVTKWNQMLLGYALDTQERLYTEEEAETS